jgi:electron transfer flavoprotein alpha subunit
MPRVAALLGVGHVSDVMAVESARKFRRPVYAGNAVVTVEVAADQLVVATVRIASFQPTAEGGSAYSEIILMSTSSKGAGWSSTRAAVVRLRCQ